MIIDDIYINQDQITKIRYSISYNEEKEMDVYEVSKFKKVSINEDEMKIYILTEGIFTRQSTVHSDFQKGEYTREKAKLKENSKIKAKVKDARGHIKVIIELSSGKSHETKICDFRDMFVIDVEAPDGNYREKKFGSKFNPEDIDIEYVCDIIFKNKKQYKEEKVMI